MSENISKILTIIKNTAHCKTDCADCSKKGNCEYKLIAKALIEEGAVIPVLCKECTQFDPELAICRIRYDSYGSVLERGLHDWCSDGGKTKS